LAEPNNSMEEILKKIQVNIPFPMLAENVFSILEMGIQPEIYFSAQILDHLSWGEAEKIAQQLKEKKLSITFHAPFMDLNPGAVDTLIRQVTLWRFHQVMDLVPLFSPRTIIFHPGYDRFCYDDDVDLWLEKSLLTWRPLVKMAEKLSVRLAVENVFEENPSILHKLLQAINSPFFGYCLDTGHGHIFSPVALGQWVEILAPYLLEIHLHDNHRQADEHLPLGQGLIDFAALFSALRAHQLQPILTIEPHLKEHLLPNLQALKKFI